MRVVDALYNFGNRVKKITVVKTIIILRVLYESKE